MRSWSRCAGAALGAGAMLVVALLGGPDHSAAAGPAGAAERPRARSGHTSAIGDMDCSACHTILAQDETDPKVLEGLGLTPTAAQD